MTGGAGFIGSYLVDALVERGHKVRVFDNLEPQVHGSLGESGRWPEYSSLDAEYTMGDVRDRNALHKAMTGVDVVFHQAAMVGVAQSMYQVERYIDVNARGTAVLLDILANENVVRDRLRKLVVASSMSIYGEGTYQCPDHGHVFPKLRTAEQLAAHDWEMRCTECHLHVSPLSTNEDKPLHPTSTYAISKKDQEEMCLVIGQAYQTPVVALRYFNTYGPRQSLSNPYTGVAAIFASRLLNGNVPVIFEDGLQTRDFVHVSDVVQANLLAMDSEKMDYGAYNVGAGNSVTILKVAEMLRDQLGARTDSEINSEYRIGDIRHCFSEIRKIERIGYRSSVTFENGIIELVAWLESQESIDRFEKASKELSRRGLTSSVG